MEAPSCVTAAAGRRHVAIISLCAAASIRSQPRLWLRPYASDVQRVVEISGGKPRMSTISSWPSLRASRRGLILLIGLWLSSKAGVLVVKMLSRAPRFAAMLKSFFGSLARYRIVTVMRSPYCRNSASRRRASLRRSARRNTRLSRLLVEQKVIDREARMSRHSAGCSRSGG
jgi:hypothetical protein